MGNLGKKEPRYRPKIWVYCINNMYIIVTIDDAAILLQNFFR